MGKKKGKANKLARMSEEERIRYLQQRAAIEAEIKMRREKLISEFMKQKLRHEDTFTRLNLAKINQHWRQILRKIKHKELHIELKHFTSEFGNMVERKNIIIEKILNDLQENEEFYSRNYREHTYLINKLLDLYRERITDVNKWYFKELKILMNKNENQREFIDKTYNQWNKYISITTIALLQSFDKIINEMDLKQNDAIDNLKADLRIIKESTRKEYQSKIRNLWKEFENDTDDSKEYIDNIKYEYEQLLEKDRINTTNVKKLINQEMKLKELINDLKVKLNQEQRNKEVCTNSLENQIQSMESLYFNLKTKHSEEKELDMKQLKILTTCSNNAINECEEIKIKGDKIISMWKLCCRLETQDERSLPIGFILPSEKVLSEEEAEEMMKEFRKEGFEIPIEQERNELFENMQHFWRQFNKTLIDSHQLREWNQELSEENIQLQKLIRTYLGSLTHRAQEPRPQTGPPPSAQKITKKGALSARARGRPYIEAVTSIAIKHMLRAGN